MNEQQRAIEIWGKCLAYIKDNVQSATTYDTIFSPIQALGFDEDGDLIILLQSPFLQEMLDEKYPDLLSSALYKATGQKGIGITYEVVTDKSNNLSVTLPSQPALKTPVQNAVGTVPPMYAGVPTTKFPSHLNPRYSFDNFICGQSNLLTYSIGEAVAKEPGNNSFNPLFIWGFSGVGKTHLVNAIGDMVQKNHPQKNILYVSAHQFYHQYSQAAISKRLKDFIAFYQQIDVLIIDDVQEFTGLEKTQNTFYHIFDHLTKNGKQLIMTCDRPPVELQGIEERLMTRFKSNMIAEMERPDADLRKNILRKKVKQEGLSIPDAVISYIAENVSESVRELEGVITSLMKYAVILNQEIDLNLARRIVKRCVQCADLKPVTVEQIIKTVCEYYKTNLELINSKSRKHEHVLPRQVTMYLIQKHVNIAPKKIGILIGKKDRTTVLHAIKTIKEQMQVDKQLKEALHNIEAQFAPAAS